MKPASYWVYEASVNDAIERIIARDRSLGASSPIMAGGVDFGGAVARLLYTLALNDDLLRKTFERVFDGGRRPRFVLAPADLAALTRILLIAWGSPLTLVIAVPTWRYLLREAFRFPRIITAWKSLKNALTSVPAAARPQRSGKVSVLCFAHHAKFVGLMRPAVAKLGLKYVFQVRDRAEQRALGLEDDEVAMLPDPPSDLWQMFSTTAWPELGFYAARAEAFLRESRPDIVIYCEGDAWNQDVISRVCRKLNIPSACLQWGAFPYEKPRTGLRDLCCNTFITWGPFFSAQLAPYNPSTRFVADGHPIIAPQSAAGIARRVVFLLNTDPNGRVTGLDHYHAEFWRFLLWFAETARDWKIIVRAHPMVAITPEERAALAAHAIVELHEPRHKPLKESLEGADLAVTVSSSSVVEAVAYGAVPFIINPAPWKFQPNFSQLGAGFECKSTADAITTMKRLLVTPDEILSSRRELEKIRPQLFAATGEAAMDNIMQTLRALMAGQALSAASKDGAS